MAPSITSVSGTVTTGNSLTITCTGAGTKVRSKPFLFADWQEGTLDPHTTLSFSTEFDYIQNRILSVDATNKRWGSSSYVAEADWPRDGTASGRSSVFEIDVSTMAASAKLYMAAWRKWLNPDTTGNYKWWRIWPSGGAGHYPNSYLGNPSLASGAGGAIWFTENGTPVTGTNRIFFSYPIPSNTWALDEIRILLNSAPGVADGSLEIRQGNTQLTSDTSFSFDYSGIVGPIRNVDLQDTKASADPGDDMRAFIDTYYVDDSWGRVYIGDNATFASCTHLELQPFTSWSDTSITINCHLGSFSSVATGRYMFLVDNSNSTSTSYDLSGASGSPAPTVISITPTSGPAVGGTTITATCTGLVATPAVTVGGGNATAEAFVSATSMTFITPSGTSGAKNVVVTNPDTQTGTLISGFTYVVAPTVSSCSPSSGVEAGGTAITLTGTGFSSVSGVTMGGTACTSVVTVSATSVTCITPAKAAAAYSIVITNSDGQTATLSSGFTYVASPTTPTITAISPATGPTTGGTIVTITGSAFVTSPAMTVTFGGDSATSVTYVSNTSLFCTTPAHAAGAVNVVVTSNSLTATATSGFTYVTSLAGRRRTLAVGSRNFTI